MNNFFRLNVYLTVQSPDGNDVTLHLSRTLPFQPHEGLTLLIPSATDGDDDELSLELGAPTYSYNESAFVDYQSDESACEAAREGTHPHDAVRGVVDYYKTFGFSEVR